MREPASTRGLEPAAVQRDVLEVVSTRFALMWRLWVTRASSTSKAVAESAGSRSGRRDGVAGARAAEADTR